MVRLHALAIVLLLGAVSPQVGAQTAFNPSELAHTYSIVARDSITGQLGVAVQTHWFAVGRRVPWAKAGVGAVATQSFTNPSYGPRGLALLERGLTAEAALDSLIADDDGRDLRQAAIVDAKGNVAAWTGRRCIRFAGHQLGDGFSVQANMMLSDTVWPAMAQAFETSDGPLAERLLAALDAAQAAGGDVRGRQSAALIVVDAGIAEGPWAGRDVDLRVDDSETPLEDLRRLLRIHRAYQHMTQADDAFTRDDVAAAMQQYGLASRLNPANPEVRFWLAVSLANKGLVDDALPIFAETFAGDPNWRILTQRLPASGLLTVSDDDLTRILAVKQKAVVE